MKERDREEERREKGSKLEEGQRNRVIRENEI